MDIRISHKSDRKLIYDLSRKLCDLSYNYYKSYECKVKWSLLILIRYFHNTPDMNINQFAFLSILFLGLFRIFPKRF